MMRMRSYSPSLLALLLLGVIAVGSAGHWWHHITDPACDAEGRRGPQPCATCSALHSGAPEPQQQITASPDPIAIAHTFDTDADRPADIALAGQRARAPPAA
jgi:hypothetical protein